MSHVTSRHQTTTLQALMSLLKGYIGTGILAMPKAFADSGYVFGIIGTIIIGILCNCCIHMLIEINELFCLKPDETPYEYEELAQISFENGPKKLRKYAKLSKSILVVCLSLTQLGFCCAYALFVSKNLLLFAQRMNIGTWDENDINIFLAIILPVMILLNFIKSIRHLSMGSTFANVIQLTSLAIIGYNLIWVSEETGSESSRPIPKPFNEKIPQFVSTTVFTYEGITVTMPLYISMKKRANFGKLCGVLNISIICVIILYCTIGFLGYYRYGDQVKASLTLSLPNDTIYTFVQLMYALAITFSYPLQMYVAIHLVWPSVRHFFIQQERSERFVNITEYIFRATLVIITFALAASIPELDLVIELIGAFSCSSVAIIIPTVLHLVVFTQRREGMAKAWLYFRDLSIMCLGIAAFTTGTYYSLHDIIERFANRSKNSTDTTIATFIFNSSILSSTMSTPIINTIGLDNITSVL